MLIFLQYLPNFNAIIVRSNLFIILIDNVSFVALPCIPIYILLTNIVQDQLAIEGKKIIVCH